MIKLRHQQPSLWHRGLVEDIEGLWEPWMRLVDELLEDEQGSLRSPALRSASSQRPPAITLVHAPLVLAVVWITRSRFSFTPKLAPGEFGAPATTHRAEAQASQAQASRARQTVLGARSPVLVCLEGVSDRRYPGDRGKVAAEIFPTLIAITQQFTAVALESSLTEA